MNTKQYGHYVVLEGHNVDEEYISEAKEFLKDRVNSFFISEGTIEVEGSSKFTINETFYTDEVGINSLLGAPVTTIGYTVYADLGGEDDENSVSQSDEEK